MDVELWASRVHSAKHLSSSPPLHFTRIHSDYQSVANYSGDDEAGVCIPCPFCYVDISVPMLCSHLQDEHCYDLKNTVCPLCAANLGKDIIGHFIVQHKNSLKWEKRAQKPFLWTAASAKELQELNTWSGRGHTQASAPDPLLSPFLYRIPFPSSGVVHQEECNSNNLSVVSDEKSTEPTEPSPLGQGHEQDIEERRLRATFVQQLMESTIF